MFYSGHFGSFRTVDCLLHGASKMSIQSFVCWVNWQCCWWTTENGRRLCSIQHWLLRLLAKQVETLLNFHSQAVSSQHRGEMCFFCVVSQGVRENERTAYHRLASVYYRLEQFEMAENYYLKSLSFCPPFMEHPTEARYYTMVYCRLGNLTLHKLKVINQMYLR